MSRRLRTVPFSAVAVSAIAVSTVARLRTSRRAASNDVVIATSAVHSTASSHSNSKVRRSDFRRGGIAMHFTAQRFVRCSSRSHAAIPGTIEALDRRLLLAMTPAGADIRVDQNFTPDEPALTSVAADDAGNFVV